jgi:hypothetical protein
MRLSQLIVRLTLGIIGGAQRRPLHAFVELSAPRR